MERQPAKRLSTCKKPELSFFGKNKIVPSRSDIVEDDIVACLPKLPHGEDQD
jgi:hypothetical protein